MYFDFEDYRPDISPVGRAISWREGVLLSIIAHMAMVIVLLLAPRLFPYAPEAGRAGGGAAPPRKAGDPRAVRARQHARPHDRRSAAAAGRARSRARPRSGGR